MTDGDTQARLQVALQRGAAKVLDNTGFEPVLIHPLRGPDYRRFLSGAPLNQNHIAANLVAPRRVRVDGRVLGQNDFDEWLKADETRTIFLIGEAGEGKSTYITHLLYRFAKTHLLLRWLPTSQFRLSAVDSFRALLNESNTAQQGAGKPIPAIVVIELTRALEPDQEAVFTQTIQQKEIDPYAHPFVSIIVVGRPSWTNRLRRRCFAEDVALVSINTNEAASLDEAIKRAHRELQNQDTDIDHDYPNLGNFVTASSDECIATLSGVRQPLLASMLKAVYGKDFWRRVIEEYTDLDTSTNERMAYDIICLAAISFGSVDDNLLSAIIPSPPADLDARSRGDPWIRTMDNRHAARHSIIAQIVVEKGAGPISIRNVLITLMKVFLAEGPPIHVEALRLLRCILEDFRSWEPVAFTAKPKTSAQLRRIARECVYGNQELWLDCQARIIREPLTLMHWAYLLRSQLPDEAGRSDANAFILECADNLLNEAMSLAVHASDEVRERVVFYQTVLRRDLKRVNDNYVDDKVDIATLRAYIGHNWCRGDFYGELVGMCGRYLQQRINTIIFNEHDETDWMILKTLVLAFQHLRAMGSATRGIQMLYSEIVGRRMHAVLADRLIELLQFGWDESVRLEIPDAGIGIMLDAELEVMARQAEDTTKRRLLNEQRLQILLNIVQAYPTHGEALIKLTALAHDLSNIRDRVLAAVNEAIDYCPSGISLALILHARGLLLQLADVDATDMLIAACAAYSEHVTNRDGWLIYGEMWAQAVDALHKTGSFDSGLARNEYLAARRRLDGR